MNKTKRKIFETSMKLFAEKGYDATSIEEITATVGVAKGTLYYHFASKEEIFNFLIEEGIKLASELGIDDRIKFLGWVSGQEKHKAFMSATIFCLPSYAEGFPMSVLDAWAYGLPVVTTPVGGLPDVAIDGENMLLFNPGDIDALARQLEKMIVDEELRNRIALASIDFAEHKFNLNTINKQLGALYEELSK